MSESAKQESSVWDPVAAYDAVAPHYRTIAARRGRYLDAVDRIIVSHAHGAGSMLDLGAGDGIRTLRIARAARIHCVVALEPSARMRSGLRERVSVWGCRITEMPDAGMKFDLITCLWNVLGHVRTNQERVLALVKARRVLSPHGSMFVDVNNRYNAQAYGWARTVRRFVHDRMSWSSQNGDTTVSWNVGGLLVQTSGHLFIPEEIEDLFRSAELNILDRWVVGYEDGCLKKSPLLGNLLYRLSCVKGRCQPDIGFGNVRRGDR